MKEVNREIISGLHLIDTMMCDRTGYTSVFLVVGDDGAALFDSGVSVNAETVIKGVRDAGVDPLSLKYIFLSHAHYDHAGGAHALIALLKNLGNNDIKAASSKKPSVYIGRADICEKLMRSGRITEGEMAGEMLPVDEADIMVIEPGDRIDLGGVTVEAIDSPGHANGHLVFRVPEADFLFAGDALGLLGREADGSPAIVPTAFAPEYRHDVYIDTVRKIADLAVSRIGFAHYGVLENPRAELIKSIDNADEMLELSRQVKEEKMERDEALEELMDRFGPPLMCRYESEPRVRLLFKSLIAGMINDLSRDSSK